MNRKVKFRGKSQKTGEWLYGDLVRNVEGTFAIVPPFQMTTDNYCDRYEVVDNTIGQFTGLFDKNGREIYEGDYLKYDDIIRVVYYEDSTSQFKMVNPEYFERTNRNGFSCCLDNDIVGDYYIVEGNIYDSFGWKHLNCTTL